MSMVDLRMTVSSASEYSPDISRYAVWPMAPMVLSSTSRCPSVSTLK